MTALCWASPLQAQPPETSPIEWYENGKSPQAPPPSPVVSYGQVHLESAKLGSEGIECVNSMFGSIQNEGPHFRTTRALGQILTWTAGGHVPEGTNKKLSSSCRPQVEGKAGSFMTDETVVASEENASGEVEPGLRSSSTPWNLEVFCGVREEEYVGIVPIGVPTSAFPGPQRVCPEELLLPTAQEEERALHKKEREEKKGCYAAIPAPPGCIRLTVVEPAAGLEVAFGGTVYPHEINGVHSGLSPLELKLEGQTSNELQCEFPAGCNATGWLTGTLKVLGYSAEQLLQAK